LGIQYADYAVWQRGWLSGEVLEKELRYWREQLKELPVLELPTDHPRPAGLAVRGAQTVLVIPRDLTTSLRALARKENATLFMVLLTAWVAVLSRYSRQRDIVVGVPVANRTRRELTDLIGLFVNALVVRTKWEGNPSFRDLLKRVREVSLEAHEHQHLPFEKLVESLQPERNLGRHPLFQVAFGTRNGPAEELMLPNLTVGLEEIPNGTAKFDLELSVHEQRTGLRATLEYRTDLFEMATVERMLGHFERLLGAAITDPDRRIFQLEMLREDERHRLLLDWNHTEESYGAVRPSVV
jgi:surfactin family lipopeptide synthetase A